MRGYYVGKLAGERLRRCYELAPPRVRRYLEAEIRFLQGHLDNGDSVLELGCGYGRVAVRLAGAGRRVVGIDNAPGNIKLARDLHGPDTGCEFLEMDAADLTFADAEFDVVACVQNGICAFGLDREILLRQALRVTRPGGRILFSTYAEGFWPHRLQWFEAQAAAGLVGELDREQTGDGVIVCRDGFRSGLVTPAQFASFGADLGLDAQVSEVDGSSVFWTAVAPLWGQDLAGEIRTI